MGHIAFPFSFQPQSSGSNVIACVWFALSHSWTWKYVLRLWNLAAADVGGSLFGCRDDLEVANFCMYFYMTKFVESVLRSSTIQNNEIPLSCCDDLLVMRRQHEDVSVFIVGYWIFQTFEWKWLPNAEEATRCVTTPNCMCKKDIFSQIWTQGSLNLLYVPYPNIKLGSGRFHEDSVVFCWAMEQQQNQTVCVFRNENGVFMSSRF